MKRKKPVVTVIGSIVFHDHPDVDAVDVTSHGEPDTLGYRSLVEERVLPAIQAETEPNQVGWTLRSWQWSDDRFSRIEAHARPFDEELVYAIDGAGSGVFLLPLEQGASASYADISDWAWIPLSEDAVEPNGHFHRLGAVVRPLLSWRYCKLDGDRLRIKISVSLPSIASSWIERETWQESEVRLQLRDRDEALVPLVLESKGAQPVSLAGQLDLSQREPQAWYRRFRVSLPVSYPLGPDIQDRLRVLGAAEPRAQSDFDFDALADVEVVRAWAIVDERRSRFVAADEQEQRVEIIFEASPDTFVPPDLPSGLFQPWVGKVSVKPLSSSLFGVPEAGEGASTFWRLMPGRRSSANRFPTWAEVQWQTGCIRIAFGEPGPGAPRLSLIDSRKARLDWQVDNPRGDDTGMIMARPVWRPAGNVPLKPAEFESIGNRYDSTVAFFHEGSEEVFVIDSDSELPQCQLFVGLENFVVFDQENKEVEDARVYGHVGGGVWWSMGGDRKRERRPAWAGESGPALVLDPNAVRPHWTGLAERRSLPPVAARREIACWVPAGEDYGVFELDPEVTRVWILHWGYLDEFTHHQLERLERVSWVAKTGLELFPPAYAAFCRAMLPFHGVLDSGSRRLVALEPGETRPTLRLGQALEESFRNHDLTAVVVGDRVRLRAARGTEDAPQRWQNAAVTGADYIIEHGNAPVVWLMIASVGESQPHWLLSCGENGWRFRGFCSEKYERDVLLGSLPSTNEDSLRTVMLRQPLSLNHALRLSVSRCDERLSFAFSGPGSEDLERYLGNGRSEFERWERVSGLKLSEAPRLIRRYEIDEPRGEEPIVFRLYDPDSRLLRGNARRIRVFEERPAAAEEYSGFKEAPGSEEELSRNPKIAASETE